ncbi:MAG: efflux RND transporter permease subunit, partial [Bacteroidales bacterium]|nr:efflux RND transporter permease subunit [Bacteroidales bacterium]
DFVLKGIMPHAIIGLTVVLLIFTFFMMSVKPPKIVFFPEGDPNSIFVYITMPTGSDIELTNRITKQVEDSVFAIIGRDNPDVESVITNVALNAGQDIFERTTQARLAKVAVNFEEYQFRTGQNTTEILSEMRTRIQGIPGAQIIVDRESSGPPTGKPINLEIRGEAKKPYSELVKIAEKTKMFIDSLAIAGIEDLKSDADVDKPEVIVNIDRIKANQYGISTAYVGSIMRTALYGSTASKYREGDEEYPINVRLEEKYRKKTSDLMNLKIPVPGGKNGLREIPISAIAQIEYTSSYGGVVHQEYKPTITLGSNVLAGYNANEIVQEIKTALDDYPLPNGYEFVFTGEQQDQEESGNFLSMAFLIAIAAVFLVLVSQFNSLSKPIIILLQVVFSMIGVLLFTTIFGMSISIVMTGMGLIAVIGIVVKNAIILIDYTDVLVARGNEFKDAVISGGAIRLTPVLLTAASTIFGLLPLAIGLNIDFQTLFTDLDPNIYFGGDSAAFWNPLAWTIIFGLTFATFLTLVVVPAMYYIVFRKRVAKERLEGRG